jgi:hypothetical protein
MPVVEARDCLLFLASPLRRNTAGQNRAANRDGISFFARTVSRRTTIGTERTLLERRLTMVAIDDAPRKDTERERGEQRSRLDARERLRRVRFDRTREVRSYPSPMP